MKNKSKLSIVLGVFALAFSMFMFTSCKTNDVAAVNSLDAVILMQNDAPDNNKPTFDSTMCKGKMHDHGGQKGEGKKFNDSLYTHTKLAQTALPANIAAYIKTNYPTATFKDAVKIVTKATGVVASYLVLLDNAGVKTGLRFDGTGAFVDARTGGKTGGGVKGTQATFDITKIPAVATTYITSNFAGYTVKSAVNNAIVAYEVDIVKGTTTKELVFDANWKFVAGH
jgi:Putative beta-lactamase-inhibitor-like, PepSY-like